MSNGKEANYSWHMSLRVDRPVEGCTIRPHAYMYSKKLESANTTNHDSDTKKSIPAHDYSFKWYRGPFQPPCAFEDCPRRTSFSPHDWSKHALGGGCRLECVSSQSSLYKETFCNKRCLVKAWKTQFTVPRGGQVAGGSPYGGRNGRSWSCGSSDAEDSGSMGSVSPRTEKRSSFWRQTREEESSYPGSTSIASSPSTSILTPSRSIDHHHSDDWHGAEGNEWVEIGQGQIYIPSLDDVGRKLKLDCMAYANETGELLMHRSVKTDLCLKGPESMPERSLVRRELGRAGAGAPRFRIVSYNILAEIYATQQQYPHCDFWALSWDYRFHNLLCEILSVSPDIICLQEVQADHYDSHIYPSFSSEGYEGVYKQKTRQSMGLVGKVDGCALFWRRSKFQLVESYSIEFNELAQRQATQVLGLNPRSEEGSHYLNRLCKDNVAQLVVLELQTPGRTGRGGMPSSHYNHHHRDNQPAATQQRPGGPPSLTPANSNNPTSSHSGMQICIANTHLYSNKEHPDVKLWQTWQLLQELESFVLSRSPQPANHTSDISNQLSLPLIICGDFNSTPDTAVYDLLSRRAVHPGHPDVNASDEQNAHVLPDPLSITHSFQLGSVNQAVLGEEPPLTNYTLGFKGTLDYMWYSLGLVEAVGVLKVPEEDTLKKFGEAMPSTQFSSDHIMLVGDYVILGGQDASGGN